MLVLNNLTIDLILKALISFEVISIVTARIKLHVNIPVC